MISMFPVFTEFYKITISKFAHHFKLYRLMDYKTFKITIVYNNLTLLIML